MKTCAVLVAIITILAGSGILAAQPAARAGKASQARKPLFFGGERVLTGAAELLPTAAQIETLAEKLSSRQRNVDPFGLAIFPREENQPIVEDDFIARLTPKITLNQALQTLKINGVNLKQKEFLLGGRNACEGDVIELAYKAEIFQAQVLEVGPDEILFRDLKRNETGVLRHSIISQLEMEPLHDVASRFESRMTPMETPTPSQR